jgi:hypothetical protein
MNGQTIVCTLHKTETTSWRWGQRQPLEAALVNRDIGNRVQKAPPFRKYPGAQIDQAMLDVEEV